MTYNITSLSSDLPFSIVDASSSENKNSISEMPSPSLFISICANGPEEPCLRLLDDGVSPLVSTRKALETETAHSGTPIGLCKVDFAVYLGSCSTSRPAIGVLLKSAQWILENRWEYDGCWHTS